MGFCDVHGDMVGVGDEGLRTEFHFLASCFTKHAADGDTLGRAEDHLAGLFLIIETGD